MNKIVLLHWLLVLSTCLQLSAQEFAKVVLDRGAHHRTIGRVTRELDNVGQAILVTNSYVELATGMHYWEDNQWKETKEQIEIINGFAVASKGPHQAVFAANLNSSGAIELFTPDKKTMKSHVLGLAYFDYATGESIVFAQAKDSFGSVLDENQVYYQDAFSGDCIADVRYTYRQSGFEQDILIVVAPPSPAEYGLNPETTRIEVWTEFIAAPEASKRQLVLYEEPDPVRRQQWIEPDLIDESLDFGTMKIEQGSAFPLGETRPFGDQIVPTTKELSFIENRLFLIEKTDYPSIKPHLSQLPQAVMAPIQGKTHPVLEGKAGIAKVLANAPTGLPGKWNRKQVAQVALPKQAYVLDYQTINGSITNYTFYGDTTYYVTNSTYLYGTNVLEGGVVIKYPTNGLGFLESHGVLETKTSPWNPAVFTARDDNSVGEVISGSSGTPSGYYGSAALSLHSSGNPYDLSHLHIRHCTYGVAGISATATLRNVQIGNAERAFYHDDANTFDLQNLLVHDCDVAFYYLVSPSTDSVQQGTFHNVGHLINTSDSILLTNSILIAVSSNAFWSGLNVETNLSGSGVFQTLASGNYYLPQQSAYRDAGTTNISLPLLSALRTFLTTDSPSILSNVISQDRVLGPIVPKDHGAPDLGYHYACLDYICYNVDITNATVTLTNGVVIGVADRAFYLGNNAVLYSLGSPQRPNIMTRYNSVQEQPTLSFAETISFSMLFEPYADPASLPSAAMYFTQFYIPSASGYQTYAGASGSNPAVEFDHLLYKHCQLYGGILQLSDSTNSLHGLTNTMLLNVDVYISDFGGGQQFGIYNSNIRQAGNGYDLFHFSDDTHTWEFNNNLIDSSQTENIAVYMNHTYNAFYNSEDFYAYIPLDGTESELITLTYESFSYGDFYQPSGSALIDGGNGSAALVGLYHFTTQTNQVKETNSTVDIGFHYVALDLSTGDPLDADGDGLPDYFEDWNGNGAFDAGETSWTNYTSIYNVGSGPGLKVYTILK